MLPAQLMMIHISRGDQQFGPYTIEELNAYLAQGSILPTDQAWYEGAAGWMPMDQVPGVILPGQAAATMAQPVSADPLAAANPAVVAAEAATASSEKQGANKKKILVITGAIVGVAALAGVLCFVWPGFLKNGDMGTGGGASSNGASNNTFASMVGPIFKAHNCYDCHSSIGGKVKEDLDFDTPDTVKPLLTDGELVRRLEDMGDERMPPEDKGEMLSATEVAKVKAWIAAGGKY